MRIFNSLCFSNDFRSVQDSVGKCVVKNESERYKINWQHWVS
jgi:hypothetical protein